MSENTQTTRIFKTGTTRITEDESMQGKSNEEVRDVLRYHYPELANCTIRETEQNDGTTLVEFMPQPGRKG